MLFVIHCIDKADALKDRILHRVETLKFFSSVRDKVRASGPLLAADGETMIGGLIVVDLPDRTAVDAFVQTMPYVKAGIYKSIDIHAWHLVQARSLL